MFCPPAEAKYLFFKAPSSSWTTVKSSHYEKLLTVLFDNLLKLGKNVKIQTERYMH